MFLREVIEGIRMGAKDLAAQPKKNYTIGFEFEVALKSGFPTSDEDDYDDDSEPDYEELWDEFTDLWYSGGSTFDFEDWFKEFIRYNNGIETVRNNVSPRYGAVDSAEEYRKYLQKQEAKRVQRELDNLGEEKVKKIKKFREIFDSEEDIEKNLEAAKQMIRFVYNDIKNYSQYETDEEWEYVFQRMDNDAMIRNFTTALNHIKSLSSDMSQISIDDDFDEDDIDNEVFIYANKEKTEIINTDEDIIDVEDVIKYYDTDINELRDVTQDNWADQESHEMTDQFNNWVNSQNRASKDSRIRYVKSLIKDLGYSSWKVVEDGTPGVDAEIVTGVMNIDDGIKAMQKVFRMIDQDEYLYTDNSTGLHVNIGSWNGSEYNNVDWLKFLIVYRADRALTAFQRHFNNYAIDTLPTIIQDLESNSLQAFYDNIDSVNSTVLKLSPKMSAVNLSKLSTRGHIEIRAPGGTEYHLKGAELQNQIRRAIRALEIASDPEAYKTEYIKKLYKTLSTQKSKRVGSTPIEQFFTRIGNIKYDEKKPMNSIAALFTTGFNIENADRLYNMSVHKKLVSDLNVLSADYVGKELREYLKVYDKNGQLSQSKFVRLLLKAFPVATQ